MKEAKYELEAVYYSGLSLCVFGFFFFLKSLSEPDTNPLLKLKLKFFFVPKCVH